MCPVQYEDVVIRKEEAREAVKVCIMQDVEFIIVCWVKINVKHNV